ncbi:hypothetical protein Aerorivi_04060 [Aeromonas rivipollensis]|uniref:hypothetical protein n=1 Tax=Aeromonas rivipollensis TaxID=948519 RepID=UPI00399D1992
MNKCWITLTAILLCNNALAYGEAGRWSSGWGQGTSEYTAVVNQQNNLYIACNDTRKVSMTATVQGKEYGSYAGQAFSIIVDGSQYDAPYETESRVGENNFFDMWGKLRQAKSISIVTADGKKLALPTQGACKSNCVTAHE